MPDLVRGMDVSNFQARDLSDLIQRYQIEHVVVRLWLPEEIPDEQYSLDQVASARANGCTVGAYFWLYGTLDPTKQAQDAVALMRRCGIEGVPLWLDLETYAERDGTVSFPSREQAIAACQAIADLDVEPGVYTGDWFVSEHWGKQADGLLFYPVWLADYANPRQDLEIVSHYWAHEMVMGHQYTGSPVDLDIFDRSVTQVVEAPPEAESPATGAPTYEDLASALGVVTHNYADGLEAEANREEGPRPEQILGIVEKMRELSPT